MIKEYQENSAISYQTPHGKLHKSNTLKRYSSYTKPRSSQQIPHSTTAIVNPNFQT